MPGVALCTSNRFIRAYINFCALDYCSESFTLCRFGIFFSAVLNLIEAFEASVRNFPWPYCQLCHGLSVVQPKE